MGEENSAAIILSKQRKSAVAHDSRRWKAWTQHLYSL